MESKLDLIVKESKLSGFRFGRKAVSGGLASIAAVGYLALTSESVLAQETAAGAANYAGWNGVWDGLALYVNMVMELANRESRLTLDGTGLMSEPNGGNYYFGFFVGAALMGSMITSSAAKIARSFRKRSPDVYVNGDKVEYRRR